MSGFTLKPASTTSNIYNPSFYGIEDTLSLAQANNLYLRNALDYSFRQLTLSSNATISGAVLCNTISTRNTSDTLTLVSGGANRVLITSQGRVGINTAGPICSLHVNGETAGIVLSTNFSPVGYYQIDSGGWYNPAAGGNTVTASLSAMFSSNIQVQRRVYSQSDRRVKTDIKPIDFTLDHYKKIRPVSYKRIDDPSKIKLGVIAQEMLPICGEAVEIIPDETMRKEQPDDIDGAYYTVDYTAITMMNTVAIKKILEILERHDIK